MLLKALSLVNFRNFNQLDLKFNPGINVLWANNGAGKSNIIEAIQLIATGRSTKTNHHHETIKKGQDNASIEAILYQENENHHLLMKINKKGKRIDWNQKPITKTTDLLKGLLTVYISPDDDAIFSGAPSERRLFLDTLLSKLSSTYLLQLTTLKHTAKLMNYHFKQNSIPDKDLINLYHQKILSESEKMVKERIRLLKELEIKMNSYLNEKGLGRLQMIYQSSTEGVDAQSMIDREARYRESCFGAHRDDLHFTYNEQEVRRGVSLGERRLLGVLLRWAEKEIWKEQKNRDAVLLLDDAFLGIDETSQQQLIDMVTKDVQSIMTATQEPVGISVTSPYNTVFKG